MPFPFWPFKRKSSSDRRAPLSKTRSTPQKTSANKRPSTRLKPSKPRNSSKRRNPWGPPKSLAPAKATAIRRHFYNEAHFQCYATFFPHWEGWITAGHCITEAGERLPPFAKAPLISWPGGLDAALMGCTLPRTRPPAPLIGQRILIRGYPAGSRHVEYRTGHVYIERGSGSGTWIIHIETPDEPVVSGMSGGPVIDADTGIPLGIIITRNSPADLNNDRDPDESCDFIALSAVWDALSNMSQTEASGIL